MREQLFAPFPWFGGKRNAAEVAWRAFGRLDNYVEPFGGSAAVLLAAPHPAKVETYNDTDGLLVNAWRGIALDPDAVASAADWPVSEIDLHARHLCLVEAREGLVARLEADPGYFDAKLAGWWIWGACCWIGSGWCSGDGPWQRAEDGSIQHVGNAGRGIHRQLPHVGDAGRGIHRQLPHVGDAGMGIHDWFSRLADRLRRVRITCGDWSRVCSPSVVERHGLSGVLLDPPYPEGWDTDGAYAGQSGSAGALWQEVTDHAVALSDRGVRVVMCGYEGTWDAPADWTARKWKSRKGYAADGGARQRREVLWCSPACVPECEMSLFGGCDA